MASHEPVPVNRNNSPSRNRLIHSAGRSKVTPGDASLATLCRSVIVANLERYPPESLGVISEGEWESLIRLRHKRTSPKAGSGGLDGTGRIAPACGDRFMGEVEQANPHLADSAVVDRLVWKDCVEYKYRKGLTRPPSLAYPWPVLVERICRAQQVVAQLLEKDASERDEAALGKAVDMLGESPMNVALLKATGVGKSVKKMIKLQRTEASPCVERLQELLTCWKDLAASSGVEIKRQGFQSPGQKTLDRQADKRNSDATDLNLLEKCPMWRDLFAALQQREEKRRSTQGKRMREIRNNLASGRPKIVKVRPSSAKHEQILARPSETTRATGGAPGNSKMLQLRKEATFVASRQRKASIAAAVPSPRKSSSFGAAVAFATVSKKNSNGQKKRDGRSFALGGGKRMKIPAKPGQGAKRNLMAAMKSQRK